MNPYVADTLRLLTYPLRMSPSFIIPGETKCGTTTFYQCMTQHPRIAAANVKEPNNFIRYGGTAAFCRMHYPLLAARWLRGGRLITGEASVEYLSKPDVPAAIHAMLPDVKLIIMFRNPVARALSDFKMMRKAGRETEDFDRVVARVLDWLANPELARLVDVAARADAPPLRYVTKGHYARTLQPWLATFPRANIHIIRSEDFFAEPQRILNEAFRFLGLPVHTVAAVPELRKSRDATPPSPGAVRRLAEHFLPYNRELYSITDRDFGWEQQCERMLAR